MIRDAAMRWCASHSNLPNINRIVHEVEAALTEKAKPPNNRNKNCRDTSLNKAKQWRFPLRSLREFFTLQPHVLTMTEPRSIVLLVNAAPSLLSQTFHSLQNGAFQCFWCPCGTVSPEFIINDASRCSLLSTLINYSFCFENMIQKIFGLIGIH